MADDTTKGLDDIMSQAQQAQLEAQWKANIKQRFVQLKRREWLVTPPPARKILLELPGQKNASGEYIREPQDVLAQGIVGMIAATGGVGKTQALIQLALAVASGTSWLGQLEVCDPGHVAILLAEESDEEAWRRFYNSVQELGLQGHIQEFGERIWPLALQGTSCRFMDPHTGEPSQTFTSLREALTSAAVDWRLIVLDPASRLMPPDAELDNASATEFITLLESLTRIAQARPTVLVAHHTRKHGTGKVGVRGASALTDGVRWLATLSAYGLDPEGGIDPDGKGRVLLEVHKSNYGPSTLSLRSIFDAHGLLHELTSKQKEDEFEPAYSPTHPPLNPLDDPDLAAFEEEL